MQRELTIKILHRIHDVNEKDWNRLVDPDDVFLQHQFLAALEDTGCVDEQSGWLPHHIAVYEKNQEKPLALAPFYLKNHSWGEYVFDWTWANAYEKHGLSYYPKLVSCIPFTPVTCEKLLVENGEENLRGVITGFAEKLARQEKISSVHWLFIPPESSCLKNKPRILHRTGNQLHWQNAGYRDFEHYAQEMTSSKRKKLRRERRMVVDQGIKFRVLDGDQLGASDWDFFYQCYLLTIYNHGSHAYLNRDFFEAIGDSMKKQIRMVIAYREGQTLAVALNFIGQQTLYGRYWGTREFARGLHFETCYYQAIEYCIANGIQCYEAGAQGEHKLSRGLLPVTTHSAHWIADLRFAEAIGDFLHHERQHIDAHIDILKHHTPFKQS